MSVGKGRPASKNIVTAVTSSHNRKGLWGLAASQSGSGFSPPRPRSVPGIFSSKSDGRGVDTSTADKPPNNGTVAVFQQRRPPGRGKHPTAPKQAPIWGSVAEMCEQKNGARNRLTAVMASARLYLATHQKSGTEESMNNRKRNKTLTIRLTELEKAAIQRKAKQAKMNLTDFVVASALRTELDAAEKAKPLLIQLGRIGRMLDRLSARNTGPTLLSTELQEIIDLQRGIYQEMCRITRNS